jgi:hypothetical protein
MYYTTIKQEQRWGEEEEPREYIQIQNWQSFRTSDCNGKNQRRQCRNSELLQIIWQISKNMEEILTKILK